MVGFVCWLDDWSARSIAVCFMGWTVLLEKPDPTNIFSLQRSSRGLKLDHMLGSFGFVRVCFVILSRTGKVRVARTEAFEAHGFAFDAKLLVSETAHMANKQ